MKCFYRSTYIHINILNFIILVLNILMNIIYRSTLLHKYNSRSTSLHNITCLTINDISITLYCNINKRLLRC